MSTKKEKEASPVFLFAVALAKANKHPAPEEFAARVEAFHNGENPDAVIESETETPASGA